MDFYCHQARLGIELDGGIHLKQKDYDMARQELIESYGIKLLRFENHELFNKPDEVLKTIIANLPLIALSDEIGEGGPSRLAGMVGEV